MVYDPDVVRAVLLQLQSIPAALEPANIKRFYRCTVEGRSPEEMSEHVRLMAEDGLIEAYREASARGWVWHATRITLEGHRYLAAIKDETFYARVKETAKKSFGTITMETIKVAIPMAMKAIAESHGIKL